MSRQNATKKFYERNIDTYDITTLLCASPFSNQSILNFNHLITEDIFFTHIYTERELNDENEAFDNDMNSAFNSIDNIYNHVQLIRICGYGGCGKTTYLRHLLSKNKDKIKLESSTINYERAKSAKIPLIKHLASEIKKDNKRYLRFLDGLLTKHKFDLSAFEDYLSDAKKLSISLSALFGRVRNPEESQIEASIKKIVNMIGGDSDNKPIRQLRFLIMIAYFHFLFVQLYDHIDMCSLLIDNIDSLDNISEEINLVSAIKLEASDISAFIDNNIENKSAFLNQTIGDQLKTKKLVVFLTTRIVTEARIQEIAPDNEIDFGWNKYNMPPDYYSQRKILIRTIDYYIDAENNDPNSKAIEKLQRIKALIPAMYVSNYYKRMFNGNIRSSKNTLCKMLELYRENRSFNIIDESINLYDLAKTARGDLTTREGLNGIVLSMILFYFKKEGIYSEKLYLSECSDHETISISRIILTILREKEKEGLSLYKLFELLYNIDNEKYSLDSICEILYDLSEAKRKYWRRLLIFETHYPTSVYDLKNQADQFITGNKNTSDYSRIKICTAGITYLELVIPHFEFMASRLNNKKGMAVSTSPLFCENSIEIVDKSIGKYRFENKISEVYEAVEECCQECSNFSKLVISAKGYTEASYMESPFNFRQKFPDGNKDYSQCYESRLIFRHVGYIENYREYILSTKKTLPELDLININKKLVAFIKDYLSLYNESGLISYKTAKQDDAAETMLNIIKDKFEGTAVPYSDFTTRIESR